MRDPKFGYHWIWIIPLTYIWDAEDAVKSMFTKVKKFITKDMSPEAKRLRYLAGIDKKKPCE